MATPTIKIDQVPLVAGTPGVSRDDLATGAVVTLTDPANGAGSYTWVLIVPPGSSATLSGAATATATFTPDVVGTYLAYLDFDADKSYTLDADGNRISGQGGAGVKHRNGVRPLGVGESDQFDVVSGWATDFAPNFGILDAVQPVVASAHGTVYYTDVNGDLTLLAPGTAGFVLRTGGPAANPTWISPASLGQTLQSSYDNGAAIITAGNGAVAISRTAADAVTALSVTMGASTTGAGITVANSGTGPDVLWGTSRLQGGSVYLAEKGAANADITGLGQLWSMTGGTIWFTNPAGIDVQLGTGVSAISVANIDDPSTELNAIQGAAKGSLIITYQAVAGSDLWTIYAWDDADSGAENVPYRVDGLTGMWSGIAGRNHHNGVRGDGEFIAFGGSVKEVSLGTTTITSSSTGAVRADGLVLGSPTTDVDIGAGFGHIVDIHTDPANPVFTEVSWDAQTVTITELGDFTLTWLSVDSAGDIQQQTTEPTIRELRENIHIGFVAVVGGGIINIVDDPYIATGAAVQLSTLMDAIGSINLSVSISNGGTDLSLALSGGDMHIRGGNFDNTVDGRADPNTTTFPAANPQTFGYLTQNLSILPLVTLVDPLNYDVGGTVTTIGGSTNQATNQRIWLFPNGAVGVQYGTVIYSSIANAVAGVATEGFIDNPVFADTNAALLATLSVTKGATDLSDAADARFLSAGKFGEASQGGSGQAVTSLQQAYNNTLDGTIVTDVTRTAVKFQRGTAADTDDVFEVLNGAGTQTFGVTGLGAVSALSAAITSGGASDPLLLANTVDPSAAAGISAPEGSLLMRFVATAGEVWFKDGAADTAWTQVGTGGGAGNTLDQAYDQGGAGVGRAIVADTGAVTLTTDAVGVAETTAFELINSTDATTGNPQHSPMHVLEGQGFHTAGSTRTVKIAQQVQSVEQASHPQVQLAIKGSISNVSAGAYSDLAVLSWNGTNEGQWQMPDGSAAIPSYAFGSGTFGAGMYLDATDQLGFSTAGTGRMVITSAGLIGLGADGTESAASQFRIGTSGLGHFYPSGTGYAITTAATEAVRWDTSQNQINAAHIQVAQGNRVVFDTDLDTYIRASADDVLNFYTSGTSRLQVANALISHTVATDTLVAAVGTAETVGDLLFNNTPAAAGAQEFSPASVQQGAGWKTDATASSQIVKFSQQVQPVQGAANPTSQLVFKTSIENLSGGAFTEAAKLSYDGTANGAQWLMNSGTAARPAYGFGGTTLGMFRSGSSNIRFALSSSYMMQISGTAVSQRLTNSATVPRFSSTLATGTGIGWPGVDILSVITASTEAVRWDASQNQLNAADIRLGLSQKLVFDDDLDSHIQASADDTLLLSTLAIERQRWSANTTGLPVSTITRDAISTNDPSNDLQNIGLHIQNNTVATAGAPQNSAAVGWESSSWDTDAGPAAAVTRIWEAHIEGISDEFGPSEWFLRSRLASGTWKTMIKAKDEGTNKGVFFGASVVPDADSTYTCGTSALRWSAFFTDSITCGGAIEIDGDLNHDGSNVGFYATAPVALQTGVAVTAAGVHAALVNLGLITA